jgi:hypothetical protein
LGGKVDRAALRDFCESAASSVCQPVVQDHLFYPQSPMAAHG